MIDKIDKSIKGKFGRMKYHIAGNPLTSGNIHGIVVTKVLSSNYVLAWISLAFCKVHLQNVLI